MAWFFFSSLNLSFMTYKIYLGQVNENKQAIQSFRQVFLPFRICDKHLIICLIELGRTRHWQYDIIKLSLDFVYLCFQAFLEAWTIACSLSGFVNVLFPDGKSFLVHPVDIGGPCRSKITLRVCTQSQKHLHLSIPG